MVSLVCIRPATLNKLFAMEFDEPRRLASVRDRLFSANGDSATRRGDRF